MTIVAELAALDARVAARNPALHASLHAGATDADIERIRAAYTSIPAFAEAWYRWHAGSDDGIVPGTCWGLLHVEEVLGEHSPSLAPPDLPAGAWAPLLTGRDGRMVCILESAPDVILAVTYDRGDLVDSEPFATWFASLRSAWEREASSVRVSFLRSWRSPMGWKAVVLPAQSRPAIARMLDGSRAAITDAEYHDGRVPLTIERGAVSRVHDDGRELRIELTDHDLAQLRDALENDERDTVALPGIADLRLVFSDQ